MIKGYFAVVLISFLVPMDLSLAENNPGTSKIYSGYLHLYSANKGGIWHAIFGSLPSKKDEVDEDSQCSIEFKGPFSFSPQSVAVLPQQLSYYINFKNGARSSKFSCAKQKDDFEKPIIQIYTNDDQEYSIDPGQEGKQRANNEEHHIYDPYLIYLILGPNVDHIEIVSSNKDLQDKYVLNKFEMMGNH